MNAVTNIDWFFTRRVPSIALDTITFFARVLPSGGVVSQKTVQTVLDQTAKRGRKDIKKAKQIEHSNPLTYPLEYIHTATILFFRDFHINLLKRKENGKTVEALANTVRGKAQEIFLPKMKKADKPVSLDTIKAKAKEFITSNDHLPCAGKSSISKGGLFGMALRHTTDGVAAWGMRALPLLAYHYFKSDSQWSSAISVTYVIGLATWTGFLVPGAREQLRKTSECQINEIKLTQSEQDELLSTAKTAFKIEDDDDEKLTAFKAALPTLDLKARIMTPFVRQGWENGKAGSANAKEKANRTTDKSQPEYWIDAMDDAKEERGKHDEGTEKYLESDIQVKEAAIKYYELKDEPDKFGIGIARELGKLLIAKTQLTCLQKGMRAAEKFRTKACRELEDQIVDEENTDTRREYSTAKRNLERLKLQEPKSRATSAASAQLLDTDSPAKGGGDDDPPPSSSSLPKPRSIPIGGGDRRTKSSNSSSTTTTNSGAGKGKQKKASVLALVQTPDDDDSE